MFYDVLPDHPQLDVNIRRAPKRLGVLSEAEKQLAVDNALRYIHPQDKELMRKEFEDELEQRGRIYGYRFRPQGEIFAKPIDEYKGNCLETRAIQLMIDNNLDRNVALYPYELVTYGETGQVCQNWMQFRLIKKYLETMQVDQTLVIASGHPYGVFKTTKQSPRVILSNALLVGKYNNNDDWNRLAALGVSNYGQFTAGGWFYIGSQGIVHGTYSTMLNVARKLFDRDNDEMLKSILFVSSGLGGMSGAQGKACKIAKGIGIIAEVDESKILDKISKGWIDEYSSDLAQIFNSARICQDEGKPRAIAYHGNILDLLEYVCNHGIHIDILTDQTSCHVAFDGGYCPQGLTYQEKEQLLRSDKREFDERVRDSIRHHHTLIEQLRSKGTYFFDYGNSLTTTMYDIGIKDVCANGRDDKEGFIYKSFVEEFLGPNLFDYGYGPFRWVCLSGEAKDLELTDIAAAESIDKDRRHQDYDNYVWIKEAKKNDLVIGSKARILYQDAETRVRIALRFNQMVRNREIGPVIIGRDHMDTGGVDAPSRETSNIKDGSNLTADMSALVFAGDTMLGMSFTSIHNGGGTGIGNSQSCGYGLVLDGSKEKDEIIQRAIYYDVMVGVARRAWAGNPNSVELIKGINDSRYSFTLPR
ncbi:MAG: urocanate hydratase [Tissierellia bacterium]|nr:urocanate hydratase [Tissierellia bacterium]